MSIIITKAQDYRAMLKFIDAHFADQLRNRGFLPCKDSSQWVRRCGNDIVQILLFNYEHGNFDVIVTSEFLDEFVWVCKPRCPERRSCNSLYFLDMEWHFWEKYSNSPEIFPYVFAKGEPYWIERKRQRTQNQLDIAFSILDNSQTAEDILKQFEVRSLAWRFPLWYHTGETEKLKEAMEKYSQMAKWAEPREGFSHVFEEWKDKAALICKHTLETGDLKMLEEFLAESRKFNEQYLHKMLPELFPAPEN